MTFFQAPPSTVLKRKIDLFTMSLDFKRYTPGKNVDFPFIAILWLRQSNMITG